MRGLSLAGWETGSVNPSGSSAALPALLWWSPVKRSCCRPGSVPDAFERAARGSCPSSPAHCRLFGTPGVALLSHCVLLTIAACQAPCLGPPPPYPPFPPCRHADPGGGAVCGCGGGPKGAQNGPVHPLLAICRVSALACCSGASAESGACMLGHVSGCCGGRRTKRPSVMVHKLVIKHSPVPPWHCPAPWPPPRQVVCAHLAAPRDQHQEHNPAAEVE